MLHREKAPVSGDSILFLSKCCFIIILDIVKHLCVCFYVIPIFPFIICHPISCPNNNQINFNSIFAWIEFIMWETKHMYKMVFLNKCRLWKFFSKYQKSQIIFFYGLYKTHKNLVSVQHKLNRIWFMFQGNKINRFALCWVLLFEKYFCLLLVQFQWENTICNLFGLVLNQNKQKDKGKERW